MFNIFKSKKKTGSGASDIKPNASRSKDNVVNAEKEEPDINTIPVAIAVAVAVAAPVSAPVPISKIMEKYREKEQAEYNQYKKHFEDNWERIKEGKQEAPFLLTGYHKPSLDNGQINFVKYIEMFLQQNYQDKCIAFYSNDQTLRIYGPHKVGSKHQIIKIDIYRNSSIYVWPNDATNEEIKKYAEKEKH